MGVYGIDHSKKLLAVVVNTSAGRPDDWFGIWSPVSDAPTKSATTEMSTSWYWEGMVQSPAKSDEFMEKSLNVPIGVLLSIVGFHAVDACVKRPLVAKLCC